MHACVGVGGGGVCVLVGVCRRGGVGLCMCVCILKPLGIISGIVTNLLKIAGPSLLDVVATKLLASVGNYFFTYSQDDLYFFFRFK